MLLYMGLCIAMLLMEGLFSVYRLEEDGGLLKEGAVRLLNVKAFKSLSPS